MTTATYAQLLDIARRSVTAPSAASDALHDALLLAARAGIDPATPDGQRWIGGTVRNVSRQESRSHRRRLAREAASAGPPVVIPTEHASEPDLDAVWDAMPPSARRVAVLAVHGLGKAEICDVLGLSDAAFRQRLRVARRAIRAFPDDLRREAVALAYARTVRRGDDLALGLVRRALLRRLHTHRGAQVGTHDPDGHLIVVETAAA